MRYKPGDRVRIKSLDWYNKNKDEDGDVDCGTQNFVDSMKSYCGQILTIKGMGTNYSYSMLDKPFWWTDEMIEGLADEENVSESIDNTADLLPKYVKTTRDMNTEQTELVITEEYEYVDDMGNVIDTKNIIIRKKKPKYPTTYKECCNIIDNTAIVTYGYKSGLIYNFHKLLVCRDTYWKIAGEEMGLGKPWKPSWDKCTGEKYCIAGFLNDLWGDSRADKHYFSNTESEYYNRILSFPTEEMRDAFYENFKELIESCKELL